MKISRQTRAVNQRDKPSHLTRDFFFDVRAQENENSRRVKLSFSSEEPYERRFGNEILDHSEGAVNLNRLKTIGCVLFNHNRDVVVAKIVSADLVNFRGEAEIEFDSDEQSEVVFQKVKNKTLKCISVGYIVYHYEVVKEGKKSSDGRFTGPCYVATSWEPIEISIVSVPADPTVGIDRALEEAQAGGELELYRAQITINENILSSWR